MNTSKSIDTPNIPNTHDTHNNLDILDSDLVILDTLKSVIST